MTWAQAKKVMELLRLGWKTVAPFRAALGGPVLMLDLAGKRWVVNGDGSLTEVT